MAFEVGFEQFAFALESTRGTAIANPTHIANLAGTLSPEYTYTTPVEHRGELVAAYRDTITRKRSTWEASGDVDVNILPALLNMYVKAVTSPTTPGGATNARLWTFTPTLTGDDIKVATMWWGDPNVQVFRSVYCVGDTLEITNDATVEEAAQLSISGFGKIQTQVATPTWPSQLTGDLIQGQAMQLWIDTGGDAIGTTAITGRLLAATHRIPVGATEKYVAQGTDWDGSFFTIGRGKRRMTTTLRLELPDTTEYDLFEAGTVAKVRVRHNGPLIEGALYNHVEVDTYGPLRFTGWDVYADTNRVANFEIQSIKDATLGADFSIKVQNARATL